MYKLIIADDEPKIRRGLKKSLEWNKLGIEIEGEAEDGEEAYKLAREKKPDIIFLDICMPFLNGLELVEKLKSDNENCLIIIITGYDEFNYMQKAIKLKVFDYLLKPVTKSNLKSTVERAIHEIDEKRKNKNYINWIDNELKQNIKSVKESYFNNLIKGRLDKEKIMSELKFFNVSFSDRLSMAIIRIFKKSEIETSKIPDKNLIKFDIINIAEEILGDKGKFVCFSGEDENIIIIADIIDQNKLSKLKSDIACNVEKYLNVSILIEYMEYSDILCSDKIYGKLMEKINKKSEYKPIILLILRYIEDRYFENDLSLEKTAAEFNMTASYLSKLLKSETGLTFIENLTKLRIENAIRIMKDPTVKICEVAELVGYSDQQYFSRTFKKVMGVSPIQFKGGVRYFENKT